ncbi:MAG: transcriptional regulator [Rhodospirillaceae bacterium]|nr:MAG: transcriptional regulator [Rhodospirillaceae bacterium]
MRIGIDLGGTKIEAIMLAADGQELARVRQATPQGDYAGTLKTIVDLVTQLETNIGQTASVGIGIPGTVSPQTGLIKNANSTCLIGQPLGKDLDTALGRPVRLTNDANCFAVSEAHDGAGQGKDVVFGVIVGTGVGGGIALNGQALTGPNAIAGEWGHNPLPWPQVLDGNDERPGPHCYCGQRGCVETFLSGPGLAQDHGQNLSAEMIIEQAENGNEAALAALTRYEHRLARALATLINVLDPDVIVLGGGLSNIDRLYTNVPKIWNAWVFSDCVTTKLLKNHHGDSSGVRGAAWLWD